MPLFLFPINVELCLDDENKQIVVKNEGRSHGEGIRTVLLTTNRKTCFVEWIQSYIGNRYLRRFHGNFGFEWTNVRRPEVQPFMMIVLCFRESKTYLHCGSATIHFENSGPTEALLVDSKYIKLSYGNQKLMSEEEKFPNKPAWLPGRTSDYVALFIRWVQLNFRAWRSSISGLRTLLLLSVRQHIQFLVIGCCGYTVKISTFWTLLL